LIFDESRKTPQRPGMCSAWIVGKPEPEPLRGAEPAASVKSPIDARARAFPP
jgi:hypothetical protein